MNDRLWWQWLPRKLLRLIAETWRRLIVALNALDAIALLLIPVMFVLGVIVFLARGVASLFGF
jgi:hypothetical protein